MVVRSQHESRGLARRALSMELRRRGVGEADAQDALTQVDDDDEERQARQLVAKRWRTTAGLPVETRVRRISGMLARKGYPPGLVSRLLREQRMADTAADEDARVSGVEPTAWEDSLAEPD